MGIFDWLKAEEDYESFINKGNQEVAKKIREIEEFENKIASMKNCYKEWFIFRFKKDKKASPEIRIQGEIYSNKRLSNQEVEVQFKSLFQKLIHIENFVLSAKSGDIVLKGEINILGKEHKLNNQLVAVLRKI